MAPTPKNALLAEIKKTAYSMKRPVPTILKKLPNGDTLTLTTVTLDRLAKGTSFGYFDWGVLGGLLCAQFPHIDLVIDTFKFGPQSDLLPTGKVRYELVRLFNHDTNRAMGCWHVREFQGGSTHVKTYSVGESYKSYHNSVANVANEYLGIDAWKVTLINHQETSFEGSAHAPFQDAILFDMLLDLVIGDFRPHTRTMEDGPAIALQILQALAKAQEEAEQPHDMGSGKRKLTIQERLDGKRLKRE